MQEKKSVTLNMIEKLTDILPTLSEAEAEAARYQIERLREENPFLTGTDTKPKTILECWEARDTSRAQVLKQKLAQEINLLRGYKVIMQAEETEEISKRVNYSQRKIYFIKTELERIKRYLNDASSQNKGTTQGSILETNIKREIEKRTGTVCMTVSGLENKNPLHKSPSLYIYIDEVSVMKIEGNEIGDNKNLSIAFTEAQSMELIIESEEGVIVGWIYFPIIDLIEAEDKGTKVFYYSISDKSTLSISFGKCSLKNKGIQRNRNTLITKRIAGHVMRKVEDMVFYHCGVCDNKRNSSASQTFYRCDWCKFTCHVKCVYKVFFLCVEYIKRKEEDDEKLRLQEKLAKMKQERLKMIIAAVDIREKPKDDMEFSDRVNNLKSTAKPEQETTKIHQTKTYNNPHTLEKKKALGMVWCNHCGERIGILTQLLRCSVCDNSFHLECKPMLFCSCGITEEQLEKLVAYVPIAEKKKETGEISLDEFKFISLIGRGTFGKVFLCEWKDKKVALKSIKKQTVIEKDSAEFIEIERKCLEIAKSSKNPFLMSMYGYFQTSTHLFFITEFASGGDLYFHLFNRSITPEEIRIILAEVILGLEYLHENNIIYRDMKLENIMISRTGHVKIVDFGLCSIGAKNGVAHTFCGTIGSIAPEVIEGVYTKQIDWWGLGVIAYELFLTTPPFPGDTDKMIKEAILDDEPKELGQIPEPAQSFVRGLLTKNPKERLGHKSINEIKSHIYFDGLSWENVKQLKIDPIWKPDEISDGKHNFDAAITSEPPQLSPANALSSSQEAYFQNF
ncbi:hypothetical protein NEOKW01_1286 [Nematocida sp. AWRm80]|nr:hypothetical protein NEOKW01_1286 [Nematocida sp. AWRm80]